MDKKKTTKKVDNIPDLYSFLLKTRLSDYYGGKDDGKHFWNVSTNASYHRRKIRKEMDNEKLLKIWEENIVIDPFKYLAIKTENSGFKSFYFSPPGNSFNESFIELLKAFNKFGKSKS